MATIRRKVKLRAHQGWNDKILKYLDPKPYYDYRIIEYEEPKADAKWGTKDFVSIGDNDFEEAKWENEELYEAAMGDLYPGEKAKARYVYEQAIMTKEEYTEWTTMSGATASG